MATIRRGDEIAVPCDIGGGAFLGEKLVTIQTLDGAISGFVAESDIHGAEGKRGFIPGKVIEVKGDVVSVRIHGSFFTTTGLANVSGREVQKLEALH